MDRFVKETELSDYAELSGQNTFSNTNTFNGITYFSGGAFSLNPANAALAISYGNSLLFEHNPAAYSQGDFILSLSGNQLSVIKSGYVETGGTHEPDYQLLFPSEGGTLAVIGDNLPVTTTGSDKNGISWAAFTDYAKIYFESTGDANNSSQQIFETGDNGNDTTGTQEGWVFRKVDATIGTYEMLRLNRTQFQYRGNNITINTQVATYAAMLALTAMPIMMQVRVVADENKGQANTLYQLWPDGKRMWLAATDDN